MTNCPELPSPQTAHHKEKALSWGTQMRFCLKTLRHKTQEAEAQGLQASQVRRAHHGPSPFEELWMARTGGSPTINSLGLMFVAAIWRGKGAALMAAKVAAPSAGLMPAPSTGRFALGDGKGSNSVSELEDTTSMSH